MTPIGKLHTASGARVILGPEIGRGGEGTVYEVVGAPDLVAKVYTDGRADDRREKIEAMAAAGLHRQASHISFPMDVLLGDKGTFVGFTMRRIKGALPIHQLWGSRDRQDKFPDATVAFMVRVAGNAARAVGELHQAGCVIGDINESGFLVTDHATVVLIDSDSIQVTVGNRVFPCVVGTPQYLPPEHQSVNQRQLGPRAANHDNFGLAVLIFRLLMAGTHPFMGKWNGPGDPPALPKWIEEFRYAYGTDAARMKVGPQPAAPPVDWLSDEIRSAFDQAFGKSGVQARPTTAAWIGILDRFEKSLVACGRSRYHHQRPGVRSCPWCETEKTRGKALFGLPPNFGQQPYTSPPSGAGAPPLRATPHPPPQPRPSSNGLRNALLGIIGVTIVAIWSFGGQNDQRTSPALQQPQSGQGTESIVIDQDDSLGDSEPADLVSFCASRGTFAGPGENGTINPAVLAAGGNTWRCMDGRVWVCYLGASGRACLQTAQPSSQRIEGMRTYCAGSPNSAFIPMYLIAGLASTWSCSGAVPVQVETIATDRLGYLKEAWHSLN